MKISDLRIMGRATQGVRLINLEKRNDVIASVCKVDSDDEEEDVDNINLKHDLDSNLSSPESEIEDIETLD